QGLFLAATISEHLKSSRSGDFGLSYHMVTKIPASFCAVSLHNVGRNKRNYLLSQEEHEC
ncbi:MAG: hypothetical protein VCF07_12880, partial [Nitrospinota bacterium]